jgi:uncharacterized protein (DUF849 family)
MIQATLNGPYGKDRHPRLPVTVEELSADVVDCLSAGARHFHVHVRDESGAETLDPAVVNTAVAAMRGDRDVAIGLTTGEWIEPHLDTRVDMVSRWRGVDYATANVSEDGFEHVMAALRSAGVGIDAGIFTVADVERLAGSGLLHQVDRVSVEPFVTPEDALDVVAAIHGALDDVGSDAPRLQHGDGDATWILVADAFRRGLDTRVGFEDSTHLPDGTPADSNAHLVAAARDLQEEITIA